MANTSKMQYAGSEPSPSEVEKMRGPLVLEFGTSWCGVCRRAQPLIAQGLVTCSDIAHIKIEDGSGRRLGRLFRVKLWPTLVFLKDGKEQARVVRPQSVESIKAALALIAAA